MDAKINDGEVMLDKRSSRAFTVILYTVICVLFLYVIFLYFFAFVPIDGESMENTIHNNQQCFVQRRCFTVNRNDIVTINTAEKGETEHIIIKRVIAMSGDKFVFMRSQDGMSITLFVCENGKSTLSEMNEPYIKEPMSYSHWSSQKYNVLPFVPNLSDLDLTDPETTENYASIFYFIYTVPEDHILFLGDNRNTSRDSRYYGTRSIDKVTSKVISII